MSSTVEIDQSFVLSTLPDCLEYSHENTAWVVVQSAKVNFDLAFPDEVQEVV